MLDGTIIHLNSATSSGSAAIEIGGDVLFDGDTVFVAHSNGAAPAVLVSGVNVTFNGDASFDASNSGTGPGILIEGAEISFAAEVFVSGSSVSIEGSSVSFEEETSWHDGGGIQIVDSTISTEGNFHIRLAGSFLVNGSQIEGGNFDWRQNQMGGETTITGSTLVGDEMYLSGGFWTIASSTVEGNLVSISASSDGLSGDALTIEGISSISAGGGHDLRLEGFASVLDSRGISISGAVRLTHTGGQVSVDGRNTSGGTAIEILGAEIEGSSAYVGTGTYGGGGNVVIGIGTRIATVNGALDIEAANSGVVELSDSELIVSGGRVGLLGSDRLTIMNGTTIDASAGGNIDIFTGGAGIAVDATSTLTTTNGVFVYGAGLVSGVVAGNGGVTLSNGHYYGFHPAGLLELAGNNTYLGPTTVANGTLRVSGLLNTASQVSVADGARLEGDGPVGALTVQSGGTIAPGTSPGILATGNLVLQNGSAYHAEIGGPANGAHDRLQVTGTVNIGASATLNLALLGGFVPTPGQTFRIIDNNGTDRVVGTFAGMAEGGVFTHNSGTEDNPGPDTLFRISYRGGTGNDVVLTALASATTSVSIDDNGNLLVEDVLGDENTADRLFVGIVGDQLVVRDTANAIGSTINDAQQISANEVRVSLAAFSGDLIILTRGGNDIVTLGSLSGLPGGVIVDGGTGFDQLRFQSASVTSLLDDASFTATVEQIALDRSSLTVGGDGNITLRATDPDGDGDRRNYKGIDLVSSSLSATGSGHIVLEGLGGDTGDGNQGVVLRSSSTIAAATGSIEIDGAAQGGRHSNIGVSLFQATIRQTDPGSTGHIAITGTGNGTGSSNSGVVVDSSSALATLGTGAIALTGNASTLNAASNNHGLLINRGSAVTTEAGAITLSGEGGANSAGTGNRGIFIGASELIANGGGAVSLSGQGGGGSRNNEGVVMQSRSTITSADSLDISGIGRSTHGVFLHQTAFSAAGSIAIAGTLAGGGSGHGVRIERSTFLNTIGTDIDIDGIAGAGGGKGLWIHGGSSLGTTGGGSIDLNGTGGGGGSSNDGISLASTSVSVTTGHVHLDGTGGGGVNLNHGVIMATTTISQTGTGGGTVGIRGTGNGTGNSNRGVVLDSASAITTLGDGTISVTGHATSLAALSGNLGLLLNRGSSITAADGEIRLIGQGGTNATRTENRGVYLSASQVRTTGSGDVTIIGSGGGGTHSNEGVRAFSRATVSSGGALTVNGTRNGTGSNNGGVALDSSSAFAARGGGALSVIGRATTLNGLSSNTGLLINRGSSITAESGAITLVGNGGANSTGTGNRGILLSASVLRTTGLGAVLISGQGGGGTNSNEGVFVSSRSTIASGTGLTITGIGGGSGSGNHGVHLNISTLTAMGAFSINGTGGGINGNFNHGILQHRSSAVGASLTGIAGAGANSGDTLVR